MFKKNSLPIDLKIEEEMIELLAQMSSTEDKTSEEYGKMVDQLSKMHGLREKSRISKETLATIGTNLLGIVVILGHERAHVIASKAFGLVKKIV